MGSNVLDSVTMSIPLSQELHRSFVKEFVENYGTGKSVKDTVIKGVVITAASAAVYNLSSYALKTLSNSDWQYHVDKMLYFTGMKMNKIIIQNKVQGKL